MSKYTTGELAKLCGVTVRTVQYYDTRGILIPSELSEGGRRLYSEDDLRRMKVICFLRELELPIDAISQLLKEEHPEKVISLLVEQQENALSEEISAERLFAMLLHIGLTVVVFYGVRCAGKGYLPLAILLHMLTDTFPALYQRGALPLWAVEVWAAFWAAAVVCIAVRLYGKMDRASSAALSLPRL